jgi:endonuclease/exonuclease/phosphatase family metal-dependent hydrolase
VIPKPLCALALATTALITVGLSAAPAQAVPYPAVPTGVRLTTVSPTSLTVSADRAAGASGYRLYASTTKSSVYVANLAQAKRSALSTTPTVTLGGLAYTSATYYYRYATVSSAGMRYSDILSGNLRPGTPTSPKAQSTAAGNLVTWTSGAALGFRIAVATNAAMTQGRFTHTISSSQGRQYTPYGLKKGTRYYFRVEAINGTSGSAYSSTVSAVAVTHEQSVRVMTYNILEANTAGQVEGDGPLAPWSQRRAGVVRLIRAASPDVLGVQEAAAWMTSVQGYGGKRQVDDLAGLLKSSYALPSYTLATTEVPPSQHGYFRTAQHILYKESVYAASGAGGHWNVGTAETAHWAAYQVLRNRQTGARFLFVSVHLSPLSGTAGDKVRQTETTSLIRQASALATSQHVPVVYAGDFNSHNGSNHPLDGPGVAFRAAHATDALEVAQYRLNFPVNSANQNVRVALRSGLSIDHVYAPAGVALRSWRLGVELSKGSYVGTIPSDHNPLAVDVSFPFGADVS